MKIAGLQRVSLIDYPDRIAASVFVAGCNLRCGYCHNRWIWDEANVEEVITVKDFLAWLETRCGLLDGVCISGGEPTIHAELPSFMRAIKALDFSVKLDTNGTNPGMLERILQQGLVDYVAMDLKAPLDARYSQMAGCAVDTETIRESMALLRSEAPDYEFRTTVAPGLDEAALLEIAHLILDGEPWFLQPFVYVEGIPSALADAEALREEDLARIVAELKDLGSPVQVRGR